MRALALFIVLFVMSSSSAMANKLTVADTERASALSASAITALKDILEAEKGMVGTQGMPSRYCVEEIRNDFLSIAAIVTHFQDLVFIDASMLDEADEAPVVDVAKIRAEQFIGTFGGIRTALNGLAGTCSKYPLSVAKVQQGLDLLNRANSLFKSISERLNK